MDVVTILSLVSGLLLLLCCVLGYYLVKVGMVFLSLEEKINESMEELDDSYEKLTAIIKKPVFFDSIEVRQCIGEIIKTRRNLINLSERLISLSSQKITIDEKLGDNVEQYKREEESIQN